MTDKYGGTPLIWPEAVQFHYNSLDDLTRRALPQDSEALAAMMRDPNVRIFVRLPAEGDGEPGARG